MASTSLQTNTKVLVPSWCSGSTTKQNSRKDLWDGWLSFCLCLFIYFFVMLPEWRRGYVAGMAEGLVDK